MLKLSDEAVAFYRENGYTLRREPLFPPRRFKILSELFEEHLARKGDKRADELDTPHFSDRRLLDFLLDDGVLDIVESLIGPDIGLWSSHFICKEPRTGRATPWREDSSYWKGRFDQFGGIVTLWLAIDRSDRGNGCMKVIPGSHSHGFSQYAPVADSRRSTFKTQIA